MQALGRGWRDVGRPLANVAVKLWASQRLDLVLAITLQTVVPAPAGLGIALSRGVRLVVAARAAKSASGRRSEEPGDGGDASSSGGGGSGGGGGGGGGGGQGQLASADGAGGSPASGSRPGQQQQQPRKQRQWKVAKGLPPLPLPRIPPGGLASCSTQPIGLPMMLVGQSAARAPLSTLRGDRLVRGLAGLATTFLFCRVIRTPFTGRRARLPPKIVEFLYHSVVGPAAAVSYLTTSAATQQGGGAGSCATCKQYQPELQYIYSQMRAAGNAEAKRGGRGVVFAANGPSVEAIQRSDINACCLPGGIVFVHSGLIEAVRGRHDSLAFVLGHEVGHAIGRHSLEKATSMYASMFGIDTIVGLAERLLKGLAPGEQNEGWIGGRLKTLDGVLQSGMYLLQLKQSRRHEYEADQMALQMGAEAGMSRSSLFSGATDVLRKFMKMEAGAGGGAAAAAAAQGDSPMSTHPAAINRLQRLSAVYQGGLAA